MRILGFQPGHDVSYCVLENGVPIVHEELERFTREKEPHGDGLEMAFNRLSDKDINLLKYIVHGNPIGRPDDTVYKKKHTDEQLQSLLKKTDCEYYTVGHHQSHAANAFFSSNHDEALIITMDGSGYEKNDWTDVKSEPGDGYSCAITFWEGKGNKIKLIDKIPTNVLTLGGQYKQYTMKIFGLSGGSPKGNQIGTVMAMACMGDPDKYWELFYEALVGGGGRLPRLVEHLSYRFKDMIDRELDEKKKESLKFDIAAGIQKAHEVAAREVMTPIIEKYGYRNICMAGGVCLNSVMVGKMYDWYDGMIDNIYVCPVPYDAGLAIGSAQYIWHQLLDNPRITWSDNCTPYLGVSYSKEEVLDAIKDEDVVHEVVDDADVVDLLTKQNIISIFNSRAESGRRALGNRSIIADPRNPEMKNIINEKVKHRQWFRPFAPSILRESVSDWFVRDVESPYMTAVILFKKEVRKKVPAVVHYDGSARLQTVTEKDNFWYYNFIKKFSKETGVPILLNTSFNDREPIVETPEHAVNCFLRTNIDHLYFPEFKILLSRKA